MTAQLAVLAPPQTTLEAVADHGELARLLRADGGASEEVLAGFTAAGVDLHAVAAQV